MSTILDHQLERQTIIEKIKNRLLELCDKKVSRELEHLNNYSSNNELNELINYYIDNEICERIQDYHQMLYDFKEDWDLNYEY